MSADSFVHLHTHTEYSMLDGAAKIRKLMAKAVALGQPAVASTDHGNVFSHYEMWDVARKLREGGADIKPVLGCELYVAPASRFDKKKIYFGAGGKKAAKKGGGDDSKDVSGDGAFTHMTVLAQNAQGLRALFELTSRASREGFYQKPRIDADLLGEVLAKWSGAVLVGTTGCPSGAVQTRIRLGQYDRAVQEAAIWRDLLGPENYFLELMDHGMALENNVRDDLMRLAKELDLPLLATNDSHYVEAEQAPMHDALLCIQMQNKIHESNRMKFDGQGYYLRSSEEMRGLFSELPEACDNTLAIAERIATDAYDEVFLPRDDLLPKFPVPEGHTSDSYLRERVVAGLQRKYPDPAGEEGIRADAHERVLGYELPVITKMGYPDYMLMVADMTDWSRGKGIRVGPGRGSAAGSGTSYALDITTVPTLEHGLLFERFINPERVSPPDVDVDFMQGRRDEVFRYLMERWGEDRVCRIQTLGTIKAKAAIKDAARVLDKPFATGARMTAAFPKAISGFEADLACVTDEEHPRYADAEDFRAVLGKEEGAQEVFDLAVQLEGLIRSVGVHACGIVVSSQPLMGLIPLVWSEKDQQWVSGFPNAEVLEPMGLLKVDCLGLDTMDVIQHTVDQIAERHGVDVEPRLTELDDPAAFAELASGHTVGMFQVASGGLSKLLAQMRADRFEDISAALALYRPGPMGADAHTDYALRKTGRQKIKPIHPELEDALAEILGPTYGVIAYQEQVLRSVQAVAGYSLGRADLLRKAMGKKKPEVLAKEKPPFFAGMKEQGYSEEAAQALWDIFLPFSAYAFNIAHTVSYGFITYATAWLKAHYPAEFMAALLTQAGDDSDKKAMYLAECRRIGITVLVPDVNESGPSFTPISRSEIRFGLNAVNGLGAKAVPGIISGRAKGPYVSFADFLDRIPLSTCSKPAVGALIRGGAFDSIGHTRSSLTACYEDGVGQLAGVKKKEAVGQYDLFSAVEDVQLESVAVRDIEEWNKETLLTLEREALGLYVSGHPLDELEPVLAGNRTMTIGELLAAIAVDEEGGVADASVTGATLAGQLVSAEHKVARSGKSYAKLVLADLDSQAEIMAFGRAYGSYRHLMQPDSKVRVKVSLWQRDEGEAPTICVDILDELDMGLIGVTGPSTSGPRLVEIHCAPELFDAELAGRVRKIMLDHPGDRPLRFQLGSESYLPEGWTVTPDIEFMTEMMELFGREAIRL